MYKTMLFLAFSLLILSCENQSSQDKITATPDQEAPSSTSDDNKIGQTNYAVIWKWTTTDVELVSSNTPTITEELAQLWKNGAVENAYYDNESPIDKLEYFPNIAFFLKAQSETEAKVILDNLTIVEKGIAAYTLHPVGLLWLDRKMDVIQKKGMTKSFVTVWTTQNEPEIRNETLQSQSEKIMELWNTGTIENVYFDIEGTQQMNNKTDFVFFVNANTQEEAEAICHSLPFFKENIATYDIYQAGVFWMGIYGNNQ